jgi:hypothetical protein
MVKSDLSPVVVLRRGAPKDLAAAKERRDPSPLRGSG